MSTVETSALQQSKNSEFRVSLESVTPFQIFGMTNALLYYFNFMFITMQG